MTEDLKRPSGNIRRPPGLKIACLRNGPSAPVMRDLHWRGEGGESKLLFHRRTEKLLPRGHTAPAICPASAAACRNASVCNREPLAQRWDSDWTMIVGISRSACSCDPGRRVLGSLSVALRAQPRDLAAAVHPVVNVGLALETSDFSRFGAWVLSDDSPVIIRVTNRPEGHFCFCHAALWRQRP
jgi:hypothetical protein